MIIIKGIYKTWYGFRSKNDLYFDIFINTLVNMLKYARSGSNIFEAPQTRIACLFYYLMDIFCFRNESENKGLWPESIYLYIDSHVPYIFTLISHCIYCVCVREHLPWSGNGNRTRTIYFSNCFC